MLCMCRSYLKLGRFVLVLAFIMSGVAGSLQALDFAYPADGSYAHVNSSAAVSGTLRISNGGETCDSDLTGAIRFTGGVFEFCSGSSWQSLSAAAGGGVPQAIVSGTTNVTANTSGYISLTTGGTTTGYFDTVGRLMVPGISTTGAISATSGFFSGQAVSLAHDAASATSIDWNDGNVQYTSADCGAFTFSNMRDGGHYNLVVTGGSSGTCTFTHTGLTVKYPTGYGATTASTHTVFAFLRAGANLYVTSVRGLN